MKAESIEQIKEHLQRGGMAMCHYDNRGAAFKKMPDPVYAIWNDKIVVDGWEKREHSFDSVYVDHWELAPIQVVEKTRHPEWVERQIDSVLPRIKIQSKSLYGDNKHCGLDTDPIPKNFWKRMDEPEGGIYPADDSAFLSLPINFEEMKWEGPHGWRVTRQGTVAELLEVWNIDDENEKSEMAQVLRHLREAMR